MALPPTIDTPKLIQMGQWIVNPLKYMHSYDRECGDIFSLSMSGALDNAVFISNPQTIQQVLDLLRESRRRRKFKIKDSGNKIESETKTFASITISFAQNPKYFQFAVNMFNDDSQSC